MDIREILDFIWDYIVPILVVLGSVAGTLFKKKPAPRTPPKARRRPAPPPSRLGPAPTMAEAAPGRPRVRRRPVFSSILEEAKPVLEEARRNPATRAIVPRIERGLLEPLRKLATHGWGRAELAEAYQVYWALLRSGLEQRSPAALGRPEGQFLVDLEQMGEEIREQAARATGAGTTFPIRHLFPVQVPEDFALPVHDLEPVAETGIAIVPVPPSAKDEVWRWVLLVHHVGHLFWTFHPGLEAEISRRMGRGSGPLPLLALSMLPRGKIIRHLVDVWLPEIWADLFTAVTLGPAAAAAARARWGGLDDESAALIRGAEVSTGPGGFYYDSHPPPVLRIAFMSSVLSRSRFAPQADAAWSAWEQVRGEPQDLLLELPGGYARSLPFQPFLEEMEGLADRLATTRLRSMGGKSISQISSLGLPVEEFEEIQAAADDPRPRRLRRVDSARWLIAFAAMIHDRRPGRAREVAHRVLAHRFRGVPIGDEPVSLPEAGLGPPPGVASLREVMGEAVVWREILLPPVAARRRR